MGDIWIPLGRRNRINFKVWVNVWTRAGKTKNGLDGIDGENEWRNDWNWQVFVSCCRNLV